MKIVFTSSAWDEYLHWQVADPNILARLNALIHECCRDPFRGRGKPEPLKGELRGWWSRRITLEDRLVYRLTGEQGERTLQIAQCRYHY